MDDLQLAQRLAVFVDRGLVETLPTVYQVRQGELEMRPYVLSSMVTNESAYEGARFGHPLLRQPIIISQVGRDHFRTGLALQSKLESLMTHLHFTYHDGMPVFDLQLIQTHPHGLDIFEAETRELCDGGGSSPMRTRKKRVSWVLPNPAEYHQKFLGGGGWIDRARRFDYDTAGDSMGVPTEFFSVINFVNYCAHAFPKSPPQNLAKRASEHVTRATRFFREGNRLGWFG